MVAPKGLLELLITLTNVSTNLPVTAPQSLGLFCLSYMCSWLYKGTVREGWLPVFALWSQEWFTLMSTWVGPVLSRADGSYTHAPLSWWNHWCKHVVRKAKNLTRLKLTLVTCINSQLCICRSLKQLQEPSGHMSRRQRCLSAVLDEVPSSSTPRSVVPHISRNLLQSKS